ncbi:hypothetical protein BDZ45DRAFT_690933 [Acephala macrosclerotiorum]|nr:hypothetical protein BDZ45DRAFT_690933 [Acephala macrosclerotiorum]
MPSLLDTSRAVSRDHQANAFQSERGPKKRDERSYCRLVAAVIEQKAQRQRSTSVGGRLAAGELHSLLQSSETIHPLSSIPDPFSSFSIELDPTTLHHIRYFENIWTQCAFKFSGCIGYGQEPIEQSEITAMIQQYLTDKARSYCLLAATSVRMQYIHRNQEGRNGGNGLAYSYAVRALQRVRWRILEQKVFDEADAMDVLFLAAYEMFSMNEAGAEKHLITKFLYKKPEDVFKSSPVAPHSELPTNTPLQVDLKHRQDESSSTQTHHRRVLPLSPTSSIGSVDSDVQVP